MREIKFRARFRKLSNGLECWQKITLTRNKITPLDNMYGYIQITDWEQYTGLKDQNDQEVFECDIIRQNTTGKDFIVKWCDEEAGFNLYPLTDGVFQFGSVGRGNNIIGTSTKILNF